MKLMRLVIIDGKSVFYRGYYAMGALSMSDGTPTGGVYGFAAIAMELVRELKPDRVVVAWDSRTSANARRRIYAGYKEGRVKPGEDFYAQIPLLEELVAALGWGFMECDEYEADDIIGTLSRQADEDVDESGKCRWETFIISSDLDMLQIVDENTRMYRLLKGFSKLEEFDVAAVEEKYGIRKSQFLDLKALKGDASDRIPGVAGIGEKGAAKLLNEYGDLEGVYANIDKIKGSVHDKLVAGKESAFMSRELGRIRFDAPISLTEVPELKIDKEKIVGELKKLEFNSLIKKFELSEVGGTILSGDASATPAVAGSPRSLSAEPARSPLREGAANFNTELSSKAPTGAANFNAEISLRKGADGFTSEKSGGQPLTFAKTRQNYLGSPYAIETAPSDLPIIIAYDIKELMHQNSEVAERILGGEKFWDLGQADFLLNPLRRGKMEGAGEPEVVYWEQMEKFAEVAKAENNEENSEAGDGNFIKFGKLYKVLTELDLPLIPVLYKMEKQGMLIDKQYFQRLEEKLNKKVVQLETEVVGLAGMDFNVNSPQQLSEVLFEKLELPTAGLKKTTRGYSTGAKVLEKLKGKHPIIEKILEYRRAAKLTSTYVKPMMELADEAGRIHTTFTQDVTSTGRLSSLNPNLQNIPVRTEEGKQIRTGFVAGKGRKLVSADYSQFELRLAAVMSGDEELVQDFNAGVDIHTKTAAILAGVPMEQVTKQQRRAAKTVNFGILYGMSAKSLSDGTGMNFYEAKKFIERYFELRKPIREFLDKTLEQARTVGYVETFYGRRRPTPDVKSTNFIVRSAAERAAQNMPIQGTEADLMKRAMIRVDAELPEGAELVMQVHDSLIVECEEGQVAAVSEILQEVMETVAPELKIKLAVEVTSGDNWGAL